MLDVDVRTFFDSVPHDLLLRAVGHHTDEGLLEPIPSGVFMVRSFTENDIFDAIEVRGTVEGLGAWPLTDLMVLEASRPES